VIITSGRGSSPEPEQYTAVFVNVNELIKVQPKATLLTQSCASLVSKTKL